MYRFFVPLLCLAAMMVSADEMVKGPSVKKVAKLLGAQQDRKVDPQYLHLVPASSFSGLLVVGEQVTTHSANIQAVVLWDEKTVDIGLPDDMVAEAMARAGWAEADQARRQELALHWVRNVELLFAGSVQDKNMVIFGKDDRPAFVAPTALTLPGGGVEVRLMYREVERGKSSVRRFCILHVIFSSDGEIVDRAHKDRFNVGNQEWRSALS